MKGITESLLAGCLLLALVGCSADGGLTGVGGGGGAGDGGTGTDPDISATDDDGDGVANDVDLCPGTGPNLIVDADGCSVYQADNDGGDADGDGRPDGDGVVDAYDLCPDTTAEQAAAGVDANGCHVDQYGAANPLPAGLVCTSEKTGDAEVGEISGTICSVEGLTGPILFTTLTGEQACGVTNEDFAVDADPTTFAEMQTAGTGLGLIPLLGETLSSKVAIDVVSGAASSGDVGDMVAFVVSYPAANTAEVGLMDTVTVSTYLQQVDPATNEQSSVLQETVDGSQMLQLGLIGTGVTGIDDSDILIGFFASKPYDRVEIAASGDLLVVDANLTLIGESEQILHVKSACADAELDPQAQVAP